MMIRVTKWLQDWLPFSGSAQGCRALHTEDQMRAILDRERMRSDRGSSRFALLTLTFSRSRGGPDLATLARIFDERLRSTDDAGLLDAGRVGILLPETPADGAWKVAEDLCDLMPPEMRRPQCDVYVYPTDRSEATVEQAREDKQVEERRAARPMQMLFVRRLPASKRAIDVLLAATALALASPLLLVVAVAVKLTSRGPVFFAQQRDGLGGRKFWIYKFRTMVVNADALKAQLRAASEQDGPAFKLKNDPRVTRIGRFLRRTCIDELPQLWNVVRGDMSIVGPRPMCSKEASQCAQWERRRLDVTPGLTCIWQVHGGTKVTFTEWMRMDLRYAGSRTLWEDLRLIAQTVPSIIRRDGVY
jgi:lipopolysaccharide/colanic/teichoic acid biosynthesis glycosyltransferase